MRRIVKMEIKFKEMDIDEKRLEMAYARVFEKARTNILTKKVDTSKYTRVH